MYNIFKITILLWLQFLFISAQIFALNDKSYKKLYTQIPAFYSYIIGDVNSKKKTLEHFSEVYSTPASCQKNITTLIALKELGGNFRFQTKLFRSQDTFWKQDIIIEFSGDPSLNSEKLLNLLEPLKNTKITGTLILDVSEFNVPPYSPNVMLDDIGSSYASPIFAASIDQNVININIEPSEKGEIAKISTDIFYKINPLVLTNEEESKISLSWVNDEIKISGNINMMEKNLKFYLSPQNIEYYTLAKIRAILEKLNIKANIIIAKDKNNISNNLEVIKIIESQPLKELIPPALKKSDNLFFDILYLNIIKKSSGVTAHHWNDGNIIFKNSIKKHFDIDVNQANFVDGSGLSRYNRIQVKTLFAIMQKAYSNSDFVDFLPKACEQNSTLETRIGLDKNIIAKTGGMTGISCLCGYGLNKKSTKVFVIIASQFSSPRQEMHTIIDDFINSQIGSGLK